MTQAIISVRVDKELHNQMQLYDEINWSAIIRKSIAEQVEKMEQEQIDKPRAEKAAERMDALRRARAFDHGKPSGEIIRKWRQKRKW